MNSQTPIPEPLHDFVSSENYINVNYGYRYSCKICGWRPNDFGCVLALENHLKERHDITPPDGKYFWVNAYSQPEILKALQYYRKALEAKP